MDWQQAIEEERAALGRIVALLCALAVLAERAAGRSPLVRSLVLWFLRQAEAVARDFVAGDAPSAAMPPAGTGPADALRLAISLRALARQLGRQARRLSKASRRSRADLAASSSGRMPAPRTTLASLSGRAAVALGATRSALAALSPAYRFLSAAIGGACGLPPQLARIRAGPMPGATAGHGPRGRFGLRSRGDRSAKRAASGRPARWRKTRRRAFDVCTGSRQPRHRT